MVDCIILDDDDDVVMVEKPPTNNAKKPAKFDKRLITQVRKHRIIYDNKHKLFSNVAKKDLVWQQIANKLKIDVDLCKSTWIELRYKYQCHVRRLRKHFLKNPKKKQQRPAMDFETELIYLWRFIDNPKYCAIPYDIVEPPREEEVEVEESIPEVINVDDDLILIEQPVELIVIDEDDDTKYPEKVFRVTGSMKKLIEQVKKYPELYDTTLTRYTDYSRKSYVWNTIANQLGDKATKLMKSWIIMETRYEWEISRNLQNVDVGRFQTDLQKVMEFFEPYIMANANTVYKSSYYLKLTWHEPIDYFKDIYNLIARMKRVPDIIYLTDDLLNKSEKSEQFFSMWNDIAKVRNSTVGQCETTWLIMRHFYWELMNMRNQNYQLTDKWYFEIVITELYDLVKDCKLAKENANKTQSNNQQIMAINDNSNALEGTHASQPIPMVTLPGSLQPPAYVQAKKKQPHLAKTQQQTTTVQTSAQQGPLPRITSAVSLAPQIMSGGSGSLQIRPIGVPQQNIVLQPKSQQQLLINNVHTQANINTTSTQLPNQGPISKVPPSSGAVITNSNVNTVSHVQAQTQVGAFSTPTTTTKVTITQKRTIIPVITPPQASAMAIPNPIGESSNPSVTQTESNTPKDAPLPKISGAISLLNHNEILIELIASLNGNHLVVHGPPLSEKYNLPMQTVAKFIREVLAIPLLHNTRHNQATLMNSYWEHISRRFNLPPHICRACWNFLLENFAHFPQIAPLKELMKPFGTTLKVWTESSDLFKGFDQHALSNGWLAFMPRLPEVVECIGTYPVLYKDVGKNAKDSNTDMEALCAWRTIALRFPTIHDISSIWAAFKTVFCQYMSDIEFGIDNKWHINWWRVLARLKYLVEARYTSNEPYYYIVSNKMVEEIERCAMIEMKKRYCKDELEVRDGTKVLKPSTLDETILNGRRYHVEQVAFLTAIEKYPIIYEKGDCMLKFEAWNSVAKELQMDVTDCLLAFRRACQKYCMYKKQDSVSRCPLNQKYYKRFDAIFRSVKPSARNKLNIKTPFELNQSVDEDKSISPSASENLVFPERYISDISMTNCESNLVVKNWIYAIGNLPTGFNEQLHLKLRTILKKYLPPKSKLK